MKKSQHRIYEQSRARRRKPKPAAVLFVLILITAAAIWFFWSNSQPDQPVETTGASLPEESTGIPATSAATETTRPVFPSETSQPVETTYEDPAARQARFAAASREVESLLAANNGRFAVYYYNLDSGETWGYQEDQPFVAASSIKLGINLVLYRQIAAGTISPSEILTYDSRLYPTGDYEPGTGTIQSLPGGSQLTVRETSGLSIRISDNCGINMIIRRLGGIDSINEQLNEISSVVDYRQTASYTNYAGEYSSGRHRTSALDLGSHAVELYRLWQEDPAVYQTLIDDLSQTEFDFGIQKGIPGDIEVAHKIGTNGAYSTENDVGIVFAGEPFVLCVMTEMASAAQARSVQAEIAALFYEFSSYGTENSG